MYRLFVCAIFVCSHLAFVSDFVSSQELRRTFTAVPFNKVEFTDSFWAPRIQTNRLVSVPHNINWCEKQTARINNFRIAAGEAQGKFKGIYFDDSDVYKILEGFAYTLKTREDQELKAVCERWINLFAKAQQEDGYLMCWFQLEKPEEKWTNLHFKHELYCAGHLTEAAVAYTRATGDKKLLGISRRLNDLICNRYGPKPGQLKNVPGHEEIELALVKLFELTGEKKYLEQAKFFIDIRGVAEGREKGLYGPQVQDHVPVRQMHEIVGHAVRAMYLNAGATDVAGYYNDKELMQAMYRLWNNMTLKKMYITGGIGAVGRREAFGDEFYLPNASAYAETCASIGVMLWATRMNLATGDVKYAEVMKQAMYNGMLAGYGMNGDSYFYVNPLESDGKHHRQPFFNCACCPSNVIRTIASLPGYAYVTTQSPQRKKAGLPGDDTIVLNMFVDSRASIELADGTVELVQKTGYPFDGKIEIEAVGRAKPGTPKNATYSIVYKYEKPDRPARSDTFSWSTKAHIEYAEPLPVERIVANPKVKDNNGCVALRRGPLVYCFEQCDNEVPIDRIVLAKDPLFKVEIRKNFISSERDNELTRNSPMRTVAVITCKNEDGRTLTAIPYYAWDNRSPGRMRVWVPQMGLDSNSDKNWTSDKNEPILYKVKKDRVHRSPSL